MSTFHIILILNRTLIKLNPCVFLIFQDQISGTKNIEDVGPEETETQETTECVTMLDVLQDENDLEEDAR